MNNLDNMELFNILNEMTLKVRRVYRMVSYTSEFMFPMPQRQLTGILSSSFRDTRR